MDNNTFGLLNWLEWGVKFGSLGTRFGPCLDITVGGIKTFYVDTLKEGVVIKFSNGTRFFLMRSNFDSVPIAWANLTHNRKSLLNALAGITFAVLLMFMQIGFLNALLDSTIQLLQKIDADLFLVSKMTRSVIDNQEPFSKIRISQANRFPGVSRVDYLHIDNKVWKNPETGYEKMMRIVAFDPKNSVFLIPEIDSHLENLKKNDTVIIDRLSKKLFGPIFKGVKTEIGGKAVHVIGNFTLGTDFAARGTVMLSDANYLNIFQDREKVNAERARVEIGLIKILPGEDILQIARSLRQEFSDDLLVFTKEQIIQKERNYWLEGTPVGFVFGLGTVMGFVVGIIICYQILFTDIMNRIEQFATIKAMGYSNSYLTGTVIRQSLILATLGFIPGLIFSNLIYQTVSDWLHLPMIMSPAQAVVVFALTLVMSSISGWIASRKVLSADPAELF